MGWWERQSERLSDWNHYCDERARWKIGEIRRDVRRKHGIVPNIHQFEAEALKREIFCMAPSNPEDRTYSVARLMWEMGMKLYPGLITDKDKPTPDPPVSV